MFSCKKGYDFIDWCILVNISYFGYNRLSASLQIINLITSSWNNFRTVLPNNIYSIVYISYLELQQIINTKPINEYSFSNIELIQLIAICSFTRNTEFIILQIGRAHV